MKIPYGNFLIILQVLLSVQLGLGQSISPLSINSAGASSAQNGFQLDWSVGEFLVDGYQAAGYQLDLGVLQYFDVQTVDSLPDLIVDSVLIESTQYFAGDQFVRWIIHTSNQGQMSAPLTWFGIYLSADSILDVNVDTLIESGLIDPVDPGQVDTALAFLDIPADIVPGDYYAIVRADDREQVEENDEENNLYRFQISILDIATSAPDLVLDSVYSQDGNHSFFPGDEFVRLQVIASNQGFDSSPSASSRIYLSLDPILDESDQDIGFGATPALEPGQSDTSLTFFSIPSEVVPGEWYLIINLDDFGSVTEVSEENNSFSVHIEILDPAIRPDLLFSDFSSTVATYFAGDRDNLMVEVTNSGETSAAPTFLLVYLSQDDSLDTEDLFMGILATDTIGPGESKMFSPLISFGDEITPGPYYLIGELDGVDNINELDETNNDAAIHIDILDPALAPDLEISSVAVVGETVAGDSLCLSVDVANLGETDARPSILQAFLSQGDTLNIAEAINLGVMNAESVPALSSVLIEYKAAIPNGIDLGDWNVFLWADAGSQLTELDEDNNQYRVSILVTSISEITLDQAIQIFPNPVGGFLSIQSDEVADFQYTIFSTLGGKILTGNFVSNDRLDVRLLVPGSYWIMLIDKDGNHGVYPFIKS